MLCLLATHPQSILIPILASGSEVAPTSNSSSYSTLPPLPITIDTRKRKGSRRPTLRTCGSRGPTANWTETENETNPSKRAWTNPVPQALLDNPGLVPNEAYAFHTATSCLTSLVASLEVARYCRCLKIPHPPDSRVNSYPLEAVKLAQHRSPESLGHRS